jgi:hypothetical protein
LIKISASKRYSRENVVNLRVLLNDANNQWFWQYNRLTIQPQPISVRQGRLYR